MNWYCRFEDRELGPLTAAQLKALAQRGEIDARWEVRREIDKKWIPATEVQGLPVRAAGGGGNDSPPVNRTAEPANTPPLVAIPVGMPDGTSAMPASPVQAGAATAAATSAGAGGVMPAAGRRVPPAIFAGGALLIGSAVVFGICYAFGLVGGSQNGADGAVGLGEAGVVVHQPQPSQESHPIASPTPATVATPVVDPTQVLVISPSAERPPIVLNVGKRFEESAPNGWLLVGFDVGLQHLSDGNSTVSSLRPIFRAGQEESKGKRYGAAMDDEVVELKAPAGRAVFGISADSGRSLDGVAIVFGPIGGDLTSGQSTQYSRRLGKRTSSTRLHGGVVGRFLQGIRGLETDFGISDLDIVEISRTVEPHSPIAATTGSGLAGPSGQVASRGARYAGPGARMGGPSAPQGGTGFPPGGRTFPHGATIVPTGASGSGYERWGPLPEPTASPRYPNPGNATPFRESVPPGTWLVGFEATLSSTEPDAVVTSVRPIFRRGEVETRGERRGKAGPHIVEAKAPPGYAVGGLGAPGGVTRDGFAILAMKVVDDHLDPRSRQPVRPVGGKLTALPDTIGVGVPVSAVFGRTNERGEFVGMGLEFAAAKTAEPDPWKDGPELVPFGSNSKSTHMTGGSGSGASAGSPDEPITVVEFGLVEWFGRDVIGAVHAMGEKSILSAPNSSFHWERTVRFDARPGYALSAMLAYGETNIDGARLIYSRLAGGKLDLSDSYESAPVGDVDGERVLMLSGRGRIVDGIYASQGKGRVVAMSLELGAPSGAAPPPPAMKQSAEEVKAAHGPTAESALEGKSSTRVVGIAENDGVKPWSTSWGRSYVLGFEVGLIRRDGKEIVSGLRPIITDAYGGVRERDFWRGSPGTLRVRAEAKEGYAVSAVRLFGRSEVEGIRLTYSRIDGDRLDISDGYNSETVGHADEAHAVQLTGRGRKIGGLSVATKDGRAVGLGLTFAEPATKK